MRSDLRLVALSVDQADSLLQFELTNRAWFERWVAPREPAFYSASGVRTHLADYIAQHQAGRWFGYLIVDDDGTLIGRANLRSIEAGSAEIGYRIGRDQVGRGAASYAVAALLRIGFEQINLDTIVALIRYENRASIRVAERCGLERDHTPANEPDARPNWRYAITQSQYRLRLISD